MNKEKFIELIQTSFPDAENTVVLGAAMLGGKAVEGLQIKIPLKSLNRHGLIAGATGTGKTKTLQMLAERLSEAGVPSCLMDLKGDLSGLAEAGKESPGLIERQQKIGIPFQSSAYPVEFLTLSKQPGVRLRSTLFEMGPILFSKMLGLNDTQAGIMAIIFKYCADNSLPLLDIADLKVLLNFITDEGKEDIQAEYGSLSKASVGAIRRKLVELEQQGAELFLGEPSFDVHDLMQTDINNHGKISILRLTDIQDRPKLFSSFMLSLLTELYQTLPEIGDPEKPKLVLFIDEAHLIFNDASGALLNKIENIVRLIRSKGVGLFFCSQSPSDIPEAILGQLGAKIQHALRAFTAKDRKAIKLAAQNYPDSEFYKTDELLTQLGIGEAAVTVLDSKGRPTPLARVLLQAPRSRMGVLTELEMQQIISNSILVSKYEKTIDRNSAKELLTERLKNEVNTSKTTSKRRRTKAESESMLIKLSKNTMVRQIGRTIARETMRAIMSVLGIKKR